MKSDLIRKISQNLHLLKRKYISVSSLGVRWFSGEKNKQFYAHFVRKKIDILKIYQVLNNNHRIHFSPLSGSSGC